MKKIFFAIFTLIVATLLMAGGAILLNDTNLLADIFAIEHSPIGDTKVETNFTYDDYVEKGELLIKNGYYTLAINEFTQAAKEKPLSSEPYVLIGQTYLLTGNYEKALGNFENALEKNEENPDAIIGMAQCYMHLNDFDLARNILDGTNYPDRPEFKYYQALLLAYNSEYERSQSYLEDVIENIEEGEIKENTQLFLNAYIEYEKEQGGQENHLRTLLAQAATDTDQYELAITILYQVLSETPTYRDAWILLGYAYLNLEQYTDSASAFEEAIELDTTKPETNYFLALAYFGQDDLEKAITYLELALVYGFQPEVQVYQKLAETYFLLEDYESATRNYEQILQLNDSDIDSFVRPIWLNMDYLDNIAQSYELAEWALASHPNDAMSYNLMGWVYLEDGKLTQARTYLEEAIEIDSELAAAYLNLGTIDETEGYFENAKENYRQAYNLDQNDSVGALAAEKYNELLDIN